MTLCPHCTGTGMESTDPEDASACIDCGGTGNTNELDPKHNARNDENSQNKPLGDPETPQACANERTALIALVKWLGQTHTPPLLPLHLHAQIREALGDDFYQRTPRR